MFTGDDLSWSSLLRTAYYAGLSVPLSVIGSMFLAILAEQQTARHHDLPHVVMPSLVPLVASVILFKILLNGDFGLVNEGLRALGMENPTAGLPIVNGPFPR